MALIAIAICVYLFKGTEPPLVQKASHLSQKEWRGAWVFGANPARRTDGPPISLRMLKVDTLISSSQFAEMIWATCA